MPYKKLESKNLNGLGWNRNASYAKEIKLQKEVNMGS
jgi:hypothetical protein